MWFHLSAEKIIMQTDETTASVLFTASRDEGCGSIYVCVQDYFRPLWFFQSDCSNLKKPLATIQRRSLQLNWWLCPIERTIKACKAHCIPSYSRGSWAFSQHISLIPSVSGNTCPDSSCCFQLLWKLFSAPELHRFHVKSGIELIWHLIDHANKQYPSS